MGTRGAIGVRINGVDKLTYNHNDSYPEHLGQNICEAIASMDPEELRGKAEALIPADTNRPPTQEEIRWLEPFTDLSVSKQSESDWYCLLRGTQGNLSAILESGLFDDAETFIRNSLFCEWAYIANLDTGKLEVYRGFQTEPHALGRYAGENDDRGYYPCALVCEFPLDNLPTDFAKQVRTAMKEELTLCIA